MPANPDSPPGPAGRQGSGASSCPRPPTGLGRAAPTRRGVHTWDTRSAGQEEAGSRRVFCVTTAQEEKPTSGNAEHSGNPQDSPGPWGAVSPIAEHPACTLSQTSPHPVCPLCPAGPSTCPNWQVVPGPPLAASLPTPPPEPTPPPPARQVLLGHPAQCPSSQGPAALCVIPPNPAVSGTRTVCPPHTVS